MGDHLISALHRHPVSVNDEKRVRGGGNCSFYLYRFCKYVSSGFHIINFFCNPGVHYEMPCMFNTWLVSAEVVKSHSL
jgi:hypothetical protein